jgi:AcrR family transcriptional regulator
VWLRAGRERRDALTRERITAAAVGLLDGDGPRQLTMRRLAERLSVAAPTLYWHVKTKDDVLDLALDAIFAEVEVPARTGDWRADARELVSRWRATMLRHPWSPPLLGRPMLGPNVLARTEFLQSSLARSGLTGMPLVAATHGLANLTIGAALTESTWQGGVAQESAAELVAASAHDYPTLAQTRHLGDPGWDEVFTQSVTTYLAGLA